MKRVLCFLIALSLLVSLSGGAFALAPDPSAKSLICLDREYNFLSKAEYKAISSSHDHTALIRADNSLWMFGSNENGKLGIGDIRNSYNAPIKVLENVAKVKTSDDSTMAIGLDGSAWVFGKNAGSTPKKVLSNVLDADGSLSIAYIDKSGNAYFKPYNKEVKSLCGNAKEIYLSFNSFAGHGLLSDGPASQSLNSLNASTLLNMKSYFITVLLNDGRAVEYSVDRYENVVEEGTIASNVVKITRSYCNQGAYFCLVCADGTVHYGTISSGTRSEKLADFSEIYYSPTGLYVLKRDGSVWNISNNVCLGKDVKLFAVVGNCGAFMIHNDNSVSAKDIRSNSFENKLNAVNIGSTTVVSRPKHDDIYAKALEIRGNETDKYLIAKNVVKWIGDHVTYQSSSHDQSGIAAFREGTGVCAAYADLTHYMLSYLGIPSKYIADISANHAWNMSIIDGVTVFIDTTNDTFDYPMFSQSLSETAQYRYNLYDEWASTEIHGAFDYDLISREMSRDYRNPISRVDFCSLVRAVIEQAKGKSIDTVIAEAGKSGITASFTDTTDADVIAMYRLGIINGTSATTFSPYKNITREEAAKIMRGLAETLGESTSAPSATFSDISKVSSWAKESVNFVADRGIMNGKTNGFAPKDTITVQESILINYRYLGSVK